MTKADVLRQPFYASGAELELYRIAVERWHTIPVDAVLTEAARLFNLAVAIASQRPDPPVQDR